MDSDNSFPEKPDFGRTWKKNLTMVWIAQFFSQIGFAFGLPFACSDQLRFCCAWSKFGGMLSSHQTAIVAGK